MKFGQASKRMIVGAGFLALPLVACVPDNPTPPPEPKAAPEKTKSDTLDMANATPAEILKMVEEKKGELRQKERDFNINLSLGNLFFENGKYIDAIEYFTDAATIVKPSEALFAKVDRQATAPVPEQCRVDKPLPADVAKGQRQRSFESMVATATVLAKTDAAGANACLKQLVPMVASLHARLGTSWYLIGNAEKAQADHTLALNLDPDNPDALFFAGSAELEASNGDEAKIAKGRAMWERLLKVAPDHPRAQLVKQALPRLSEFFSPSGAAHPPVADNNPHAGGAVDPHAGSGANPHGGAPMQGPGPLPPGMEEIAKNTPQTPEMEAQINQTLDKGDALLKDGKWEEALATFKTIMPIRPSGRVALGMGIALRELGKPTAEMVLTQATKMPGGDPSRARFELAKFYESKNPGQAKAIYTELTSDTKYGADAKARLAVLK